MGGCNRHMPFTFVGLSLVWWVKSLVLIPEPLFCWLQHPKLVLNITHNCICQRMPPVLQCKLTWGSNTILVVGIALLGFHRFIMCIYIYRQIDRQMCILWRCPKMGGTPKSSIGRWIFHQKASILGMYPHFRKPPCTHIHVYIYIQIDRQIDRYSIFYILYSIFYILYIMDMHIYACI